jgi:DNA-binding transcriptional regulator YhcF (GntR family)
MQLWFARGSEVSIREQLVTQVVLGILGDDLAPGQRLPSTRELARRFNLHPNTVSAGYRQLARDRWVENRRGSGVFVRAKKPEIALSSGLALDQMIAGLFREARKRGTSLPTFATTTMAGIAAARPFSIDRAGRRTQANRGGRYGAGCESASRELRTGGS